MSRHVTSRRKLPFVKLSCFFLCCIHQVMPYYVTLYVVFLCHVTSCPVMSCRSRHVTPYVRVTDAAVMIGGKLPLWSVMLAAGVIMAMIVALSTASDKPPRCHWVGTPHLNKRRPFSPLVIEHTKKDACCTFHHNTV